jgi:hypothetical protein
MEVGYRYWHYTSGPFFDAVIAHEKQHDEIFAAWTAFAEKCGGVPAYYRAFGNTYFSGVVFKDPPKHWLFKTKTQEGDDCYKPHSRWLKALYEEMKALPVQKNIAQELGFEEAVRDGKYHCFPRCGVIGAAPNQIVYVQAYQNDEVTQNPPEGGKELLTWEWEKWKHELSLAKEGAP